jgi:hypothetical protein
MKNLTGFIALALCASFAQANTFEVSSTGDNGGVNPAPGAGTGTLRQAIVDANAAGGTQTIAFDALGACGQRITLAAPLPDLNAAITIDGYTASGSAANASATIFDGTVCVALDGHAAITYALRTASSSSATISGLAFGGFTAEAIWAHSGSTHHINGNLFGVSTPQFTLGANGSAVLDDGGSPTYVGDTVASARNVIGNSSNAGVIGMTVGGGLWVQNNLIGVDRDGVTAAPNAVGVRMQATCGNPIYFNVIAHNTGNGVYQNGGSCSQLKSNRIGIDALGNAAGNGGYGVEVDGGSNNGGFDDYIGGFVGLASGDGNVIAYNALGGVYFYASASFGNVIVENLIYGNGGKAIVHNTVPAPQLGLIYAKEGKLLIRGVTTATAFSTVWIEMFYDTVAQPDGGARYRLGRQQTHADASGNAPFFFSVNVPAELTSATGYFIATASTSETSAFAPIDQQEGDVVFVDAFEDTPVPMLP